MGPVDVSDRMKIGLTAASGVCVQKSLQTIDEGLIQLSNVNACDSPAAGTRTPAAPPENSRPAPNRPTAPPSLNAYAAGGPSACAPTVGTRRMRRNASRSQFFMTAIVRTAVARRMSNAYRSFTLLARDEH